MADGWSLRLLTEELAALVRGEAVPAPMTEIQYGDYAVWQQHWLSESVLGAELAWWRAQLHGAPAEIELPTDRPRPAVSTHAGARHVVTLPNELLGRLDELAAAQGATLFMVLTAAVKVLLARYTGKYDIVVGAPVSGRATPELERLIGYLANTLVLRTQLDGDPAFAEVLARVKQTTLDALARQDVPFERLVEALAPDRDLSRNPLFQVLVMLQDDRPPVPDLPETSVELLDIGRGVSRFDLSISFARREGGLRVAWEYSSELFDHATVERFSGALTCLLEGITVDPGAQVSRLPIVPAAERQALSELTVVATSTEIPNVPVHELVAAQAAQIPGAVAVTCADRSLTYRELDERANQLAHALVDAGARPGVLVGLCIDRSVDLIVAIHGVLRAGAAYIPLDPDYPRERVEFMLADARAAVLVTRGDLRGGFDAGSSHVICVDDASVSRQLTSPLPARAGLDDLAYVVYTSGSSGLPKGVMLEHRNLVNLLWSMADHPGVQHGETMLGLTTPAFDLSVPDLYLPLMCGGTLALATAEQAGDPRRLAAVLHETGATVVQATPSTWRMLLDDGWVPERPMRIVVGGEAVPVGLAERLARLMDEAWNFYGPTETCVWSTRWRIEPPLGTEVPIGRPIGNTACYIVDAHDNLVPPGVLGELLIGGIGVARGYLQRSELTAERFGPDPFAQGGRVYRTGDLVRLRPDGLLGFGGRRDDQVKLRGFRIELGEITTTLEAHDAVRHAVVIVREDEPGDQRLVAYVVGDGEVTPAALRDHLSQTLPGYMVPSAFVHLSRLPLTPNDKLDRTALKAPESTDRRLLTAPRTPLEERLVGFWAEALRREDVGVHDNLFHLGAHSLLVTRVVARIRETLDVEIPASSGLRGPNRRPTGRRCPRRPARSRAGRRTGIPARRGRADAMSDRGAKRTQHGAELFQQRLAGLSPEKRALLEQRLLARRQSADAAPTIIPRGSDGPPPLSYVQELMWLVHELDPGSYTYNSSGARRLRGVLDGDALERAINRVIERHSALRTSFELRDGAPVQIVNRGLRLPIERVQARGVDGEELLELLRTLVRRPFDLTTPLLIRATLVEIAAEDHVLLTSAHHIVWDGWSKGIYFRELAQCYDAFCSGAEPELPMLPLQYADFAVWQREWLSGERMQSQLDYWRQALAGAPPLLDLPTDRPRPAVASHRGDRLELWVPAETLSHLRDIARRYAATEFMLLVAAWATLLHRLSGQDTIVLGTPIAGRNRAEVECMIGYFNNTLALRIDCSGDPSFLELLGRVRETSLSAYSNQDVSFEHVVRELAPQRDTSYSPVFQSLIVLQNASQESSLELRGLELEMIVTESGTAKFDLSLGMGEYDGKLHASFEYNEDLFDRETVEGFRGQFARLLDAIVADPETRLSELPLLSDGERGAAAAGPVRDVPFVTLHDSIAERVAATPASIAIVSSEGEMSYGELGTRAATLARGLCERGLGREDRIGLCLQRSPDLVVAMVGILSSGAAVVPLDPEYPDARLRTMVEDAELGLVITEGLYEDLIGRLGASPLTVSQLAESVGEPETVGLNANQGEPGDAAFVLFTSGSAGRPKGVVLGHRGLVNHALAAIDLYGVTAAERTLQFASISFDISIEEIFTTLLAGGTLVLRDDSMPLGGPGLLRWLERHRISFMDLPTAFWHEWVRDLDCRAATPPATLRRLVVGGERVSVTAWETWRRIAPQVRWFNTYGPTEASVIATAFEPPPSWEKTPGVDLPIGKPLPNVVLHVLDEHGRPVPAGVRGELYIGGVGVAHGYLGQPEATARSFPNLAASEERVYRTGDLVKMARDGLVEFVGRSDEQIKLRGFRIEPAEVEAALVEVSGVTAALVTVHGDSDPRLVAYVVGDREAMADATAIRRAAASRLPGFAVPSAVVVLDAFPLTPNGKLDRDALPEPRAQTLAAAPRIAPRDDTERVFAEIWSELLGVEVAIDDDFFELGGHSMLAVRMLTQVEERLGVRLRLASLVRTPTIRGLAEGVAVAGDEAGWRALVEMKPDGARPPLFLIHSVTGDVLIYRDLVRRLAPEQPAWGLEALGADGRQIPMLAIADMARHYIAEIRTVQPHGPYYLAGLCYGGNVAHEMAHQLEETGERVAFVGLIDANPFGVRPQITTARRVFKHVGELFDVPRGERSEFVRATGHNFRERVEAVVRWRIKKSLYLGRGRALPSRLVDMQEINTAATVGYVTPIYGGRLTLFRLYNPDELRKPRDVRLRWAEFTSGGLDVRDVTSAGAVHFSVLYEPHVGALAAALEQAIVETLEPPAT